MRLNHFEPLSLPSHRGFSRADLLVLAGIGAFLLSLQLSSIGQSRSAALQAICAQHSRDLTVAWQMYASDNNERLPAAGRHSSPAAPPDWTTGSKDPYTGNGEWLDLPIADEEDINPELSIIGHNKLWPYTQSVETFRCPADPSTGSHPNYKNGEPQPRVRSYSINNWVGGPAWEGGGEPNKWQIFKRTSDFVDLSPDQAFVFIDEREDSINDGTFLVEMRGWNTSELHRNIVDFPTDWHNGGANLSFADGHVEYWKWEDARTMPPHRFNEEMQLNVASPFNPDVHRLRSVTTRPK